MSFYLHHLLRRVRVKDNTESEKRLSVVTYGYAGQAPQLFYKTCDYVTHQPAAPVVACGYAGQAAKRLYPIKLSKVDGLATAEGGEYPL